MRVAPMTQREVDACAELALQHPLFRRYGLTAAGLRETLASPPPCEHRFLVSRADGEPAGFVWLVRRGAFSRSGYIRLLAVAERYQGTGVADSLMQAAEDELMADGSDVLLLVNSSNARAIRFYERRGYRQAGVLEDYAAPGENELILRKRTAGATASQAHTREGE